MGIKMIQTADIACIVGGGLIGWGTWEDYGLPTTAIVLGAIILSLYALFAWRRNGRMD